MKWLHIKEHSRITSAKSWVGGVRKWQFLLIYSTIYADVGGWEGLKKPKTCWSTTWMVPYSIHNEMKHFLKYFSHISRSKFSQDFSSILCQELFNIFCIEKIFLRHLKIYQKSNLWSNQSRSQNSLD